MHTPGGAPPSRGPELEHILQILRRALFRDPEEPVPEGQPEERVFVRGTDPDGLLQVVVQSGDTAYQLKVPDVQTLVSLVGPQLRTPRGDDALVLPYQPRTSRLVQGPESTPEPGKTVSVVRGGDPAQTMSQIAVVRGEVSCVACFTSRGPTAEAQKVEYKPINEDAVAIRLRKGNRTQGLSEITAVGAFDMAGGEGRIETRVGAASDEASRCFDEAVARIEGGADPESTLRESVQRASDAVRGLGVGAVSTYTGAVLITSFQDGKVSGRKLHVVSVGDSRALLVDKDGRLKQKSRLHNLGANIAAGEVQDAPPSAAHQFASALSRGLGTENDTPDLYVWDVAAGDRLLVETDGVGDAREFEEMPTGTWHADKCAEDQAKILKHVQTAPDAVTTLVGYALDQMSDRYGKPDNVGLAVLQVLE